MLKLHESYTIPSSLPDLEAKIADHIVALVPSPDTDFMSITRKVWGLAQASGSSIRLIGVCNDTSREPAIRRTLVTMSAMLNDGSLPVSMEVLVGTNWLQRLEFHLGPQDIVVCWDEPNSKGWAKPFSQLRQAKLEVPLYNVSTQAPVQSSRTNLMQAAVAWLGFIAITIGFLLLQIKLYQLANQWTITLEILSTACELWLIWVWNNLF